MNSKDKFIHRQSEGQGEGIKDEICPQGEERLRELILVVVDRINKGKVKMPASKDPFLRELQAEIRSELRRGNKSVRPLDDRLQELFRKH